MTELDDIRSAASTCTRCRLSAGRTQVVFGVGHENADLMFIGEGPGFHEDKQGEPFVGAAGQLLNRLLAEIGLSREQVRIVNVVMCRPPGNRDPMPDEIESCRSWLDRQLELVNPRVVVTLGRFATQTILGRPAPISKVRGRRQAWGGRVVIPTFHPAAALRGGGEGSPTMLALREDFATIREILDEPTEPGASHESAEPGASGEADGVPAEQLGLF